MAEDGPSNSGMGDLEKDLTCSICTDILYQPLTLLDCLHSFCGSCLKEWFHWQATSAAQQRRRNAHPYTCPSCRESVRTTKADWRLTTLLEGYLKANLDRAKSAEEKEEISKHYKHGEDILLAVHYEVDEDDSGDERLLAQVRDISMADVDPDARRRADRGVRHGSQQVAPASSTGRQHSRLTESRLREHDAEAPHIGHQPSLRSLLSVSDTDPHEVQAEILQSIYSEGLLDGIDIENLTTEQEEELTERIAEAYRRRQRRRDRSGSREQRERAHRSPRSRPHSERPEEVNQNPVEPSMLTPPPVQQSRDRPPISRPHLFEQNAQSSGRSHQRSASSTSQRSNRSATLDAPSQRSGTDPTVRRSSESTRRDNSSRPASSGRRSNDRATDNDHRNASASRVNDLQSQQGRPRIRHSTAAIENGSPTPPSQSSTALRTAVSRSDFAPEPLVETQYALAVPSVKCDRCEKAGIEYELHYNCHSCRDGLFNLCIQCYRNGRGCEHWFGFGYRAFERWNRDVARSTSESPIERPHVLLPRKYVKPLPAREQTQAALHEGASCEQCFSLADPYYWYCSICLDGAWGFCHTCVRQGKHCTHQLLPVAHVNTQSRQHRDDEFIPMPHLEPKSYVAVTIPTICDICHSSISLSSSRFHCYQCNSGDYDVCRDCYHGLVSQGKLSSADGPGGWRRCLSGHRMAVITDERTADGFHLRTTVRQPVGGFSLNEDSASLRSSGTLPPDGGEGMQSLALYSYFPPADVTDELAFPRNAEIREVVKVNTEWFLGTYAGQTKLFPSNHVQIL